MKNAIDSHESSSRGGELVVPPHHSDAAVSGDALGDSPTVSFVGSPEQLPEQASELGEPGSKSTEELPRKESLVNDSDKTVISQRPVAPPAEFYRSAPLAELASTLEGKQLDHFSVQTMIGGGGMGAVFRGVDTRLDRVVAVKVIPASRREPETLRRFRLEAQAAARLDHPNIARVYYVGEAEPWNYIVFEFIDGINIRDLVEMEGPLSVDDAVFYTRQVAEALQHAHEREVVHRDVKPSNVLVTASGIAKLVDMGLARDTSLDKSTADVTASGVTLGTFDYISPEQARNPRDADVRSDLYSLGCTLFYMLTGSPPFPDGTALQKLLNHGSIPPPDPRQVRPDISDQLYEIVMKLMSKKPSDRYQKPIDLVNDLLLLAEAENLPRSQGPSTLLVRPSIAQRSLIETHLPWIVATLALFGSSLWLQSIQSLPGGVTLPELKFDAVSNNMRDSSSAIPGTPASLKGAAGGSVVEMGQGTTPATQVVSDRSEPAQVPPTAAAMGLSTDPSSMPARPSLGELPQLDAVDDSLPTIGLPKNGSRVPEKPPGGGAGDPADRGPIPAAGLRGGVLVVSASRPIDIASEQWEPSLANAVQRVAGQSAILEIRGLIRVSQPIVLDNQNLEIVAYPGSAAVLQVSSDVLSGPANAAFVLNRSKVRLSDMQLQVNSESVASKACLFRIREGSTLLTDSCLVRVVRGNADVGLGSLATKVSALSSPALGSSMLLQAGAGAGMSVFEVLGRVEEGRTSGESLTLGSPSDAAGELANLPVALSCSRSQFLGDATLIDIEPMPSVRPRIELSIEDCLVAIEGVALRVMTETGEGSSERILRLYCKNSTFVTRNGFASLYYRGELQPLLGLSRTSQNCAYWSPSGVAHLAVYGDTAGLLENPNLLSLQGFDNAYDEGVESLCKTFAAGTEIFELDFVDGQQEGWFSERSIEREIRWLDDPRTNVSFAQAKAATFAIEEAMFTPGYRP